MEPKELKKILASVSLAGLIAAGGAAMIGCASSCGKSSCASGKPEKEASRSEKGKTACGGGSSCGGKTACGGGSSCG